jgi:uncharacterized membrane protein
MGEMLAVLFIGSVFVVSGLILLFTSDDKGRKLGIWLLVAGLIIYFVTWLFTPNNQNFHLSNENIYQQ